MEPACARGSRRAPRQGGVRSPLSAGSAARRTAQAVGLALSGVAGMEPEAMVFVHDCCDILRPPAEDPAT